MMHPGPRDVRLRIGAVVAVVVLHLLTYLAVTRVNARRPERALWDLSTRFDAVIPHLPSTWPLYWLVYLFVPLAGGYALLHMSEPAFRRAVVAYAGMMLVGACVQLLVPARAPWPESPAAIQHFYHTSGLVLPYANLPSMHVAFATLTAGMLLSVVPTWGCRVASSAAALLITTGTLTLKEHFVLDAVGGVVLALATWGWWRALEAR